MGDPYTGKSTEENYAYRRRKRKRTPKRKHKRRLPRTIGAVGGNGEGELEQEGGLRAYQPKSSRERQPPYTGDRGEICT